MQDCARHTARMSIDEEYREWEQHLPREITDDALWTCAAYRLATFVADRAWDDLTSLGKDYRTRELASQLAGALGGIGATYAEAYSRRSYRDRRRYYEYSLGSARESRDWYFKARHIIGEQRYLEALQLLTRIVRLLTVTITREGPEAPPDRRKKPPRRPDE